MSASARVEALTERAKAMFGDCDCRVVGAKEEESYRRDMKDAEDALAELRSLALQAKEAHTFDPDCRCYVCGLVRRAEAAEQRLGELLGKYDVLVDDNHALRKRAGEMEAALRKITDVARGHETAPLFAQWVEGEARRALARATPEKS